jgi:hypothetical protein
MTTTEPDALLQLLPAVYRARDEEHHRLRALLRVIAEQVAVVGDDLDRWYDNWFVETCDDELLPQFAMLVGVATGTQLAASGLTGARAERLVAALAPRRAIADAVTDRRAKGTAAGLEAVAEDAAAWPSRAVETYARLIRDQHVRHVRLRRPASLDVRDALACERLGGPFDDAPHRVDVRRIDSEQTRGLHNIPSLALYIWRLRSFAVTRAPAFCIDQRYSRYLVNVLGIDTPLFSPQPDGPAPAFLTGPADVPHPIRRVEFAASPADHYGPGRGLMIWRDADRRPVPAESIVVADLTGWAYRPGTGQVAVDPELGRIAFAGDEAPEDGVWVSWHYGFSDAMGGGSYLRPRTAAGSGKRYVVTSDDPADHYGSISAALNAWTADKKAAADAGEPVPHAALIEIADSADYSDAVRIDLDLDDRLELRAARGCRPVLRLLNQRANRFDALMIRSRSKEAPPGSVTDCPPPSARLPRVLIDGLVVTGRSVDVVGQIGEVELRHCTLVPGWALGSDCEPRFGEEPSIELRRTPARLLIAHSIVGTVVVDADEVGIEPNRIEINDSIVDATADHRAAITAPDDGRPAWAELVLRRCTVFGEVLVHLAELVEDCLLTGCLHTGRPADGCVRFSAVQPSGGWPPVARPVFTSRRYGHPGYAQLGATCPAAIAAGAQDGAELGVFHDLFQPQRMANLAARLAEYVPMGVDAAVIPAT